jgi:hypothetical protein
MVKAEASPVPKLIFLKLPPEVIPYMFPVQVLPVEPGVGQDAPSSAMT